MPESIDIVVANAMVMLRRKVLRARIILTGRVEFIRWELLSGIVRDTNSGEMKYLIEISLHVKIVNKSVETWKHTILKPFLCCIENSY